MEGLFTLHVQLTESEEGPHLSLSLLRNLSILNASEVKHRVKYQQSHTEIANGCLSFLIS